MSALNVTLYQKTGNINKTMYPATTDGRINITASSDKIPTGIDSLEDLINALGTLAFEDYVALNVSTEENYGLVRITNSDSTATNMVPTAKLLHDSMATKMSLAGSETVTGTKTFSNGLVLGNIPISYDSTSDTMTFGTAST